MNRKAIKNQKGFTLIETLVAIMMVSIAFLGIYSATAKYQQQTKQIKEIYMASLLGQEGIEIVRNIRDKNWVTGAAFTAGLTSCSCSSGAGCEAEYDDSTLTTVTPTWINNGRYLYLQGGNSFYTYDTTAGNTKTNYKRQICILPEDLNADTDDDVLHVLVNVYWVGGRQTTIKEDLYNWKW